MEGVDFRERRQNLKWGGRSKCLFAISRLEVRKRVNGEGGKLVAIIARIRLRNARTFDEVVVLAVMLYTGKIKSDKEILDSLSLISSQTLSQRSIKIGRGKTK